jgi:hypothetical protein
MLWEDQHGRKWEVEIDPAGMSWTAPPFLKSDRPIPGAQHYLEHVKNEYGEPTMGKLYVNYPKWRRDLQQRLGEWEDSLRETAKKMFPNSFGEVLRDPPRDLLVEVGPGPLPVEFVEAMEAGNSWALGRRKADGTFHPRPKWVTESMLDRATALRRTTGYRLGTGRPAEFDAAKYLDDEEVADPEAVGGKTVKMGKR